MRHILSIALLLTTLTTQAQRSVCDMSDLERAGYKGQVQFVIKKTSSKGLDKKSLYSEVVFDTIHYDTEGCLLWHHGLVEPKAPDNGRPFHFSRIYNHNPDSNSYTMVTRTGSVSRPPRHVSRTCPDTNTFLEREVSNDFWYENVSTTLYHYKNGILAGYEVMDATASQNATLYSHSTKGNIKTVVRRNEDDIIDITTYTTLARDSMGNPTNVKKSSKYKGTMDAESHSFIQYVYYP